MATPNQIEFFDRLTNDRDLGPLTDMPALKTQFATLTDKNASQWIEAATSRPKRSSQEVDEAAVAPPFA